MSIFAEGPWWFDGQPERVQGRRRGKIRKVARGKWDELKTNKRACAAPTGSSWTFRVVRGVKSKRKGREKESSADRFRKVEV